MSLVYESDANLRLAIADNHALGSVCTRSRFNEFKNLFKNSSTKFSDVIGDDEYIAYLHVRLSNDFNSLQVSGVPISTVFSVDALASIYSNKSATPKTLRATNKALHKLVKGYAYGM